MKQQYEQHFNAAALKAMNVPVIKKVKKKHLEKIESWIESNEHVHVQYDDTTEIAVEKAVNLGFKR
jgi:hypothetical protein